MKKREFYSTWSHPLADWLTAAMFMAATIIAANGFVNTFTRIVRATRLQDFKIYYLSARLVEQSSPVDLSPMGYIYPPFFIALFRPLALLPFREAGLVWLGASIGAIVLILLLLTRALSLTFWQTVALGFVAVVMPATLETLDLGQVSLLLTLLFVAALVSAPRTDLFPASLAAGLLIGVAAGMKVYPILLAVPYIFYRRWKILAVIGCTFVGTLVVGMLAGGGIQDTWVYWTQVLPQVSELNLYPPNQSARASLQRLFEVYLMETTIRRQPVTIPLIPIFDAPMLGRIVGWATALAIAAVTAFVFRRRARILPNREGFVYDFALMVPTILLIIPLSWDHYEPHLILPLAVVGMYGTVKAAPRLFFGLAFLLLALHRYWNVALFETPYAWLMMFGFLGTLCIWFALLWDPPPKEQMQP